MQKTIIFLIISLSSISSYGQLYFGTSVDESRAYNCMFRVNADSSIDYVYNQNQHAVYAEFDGRITKITDSTYMVKAECAIGQYYMKSWVEDTLLIQLNPHIARTLDKIEIEYSDEKTRKLLQGYDNHGKPIELLKIPINKDLFNDQVGSNFIEITVNRRNRITRKWVSFEIPYGSAAYITSGEKIEFEVMLKGGVMKSIGDKPSQTGHILLEVK